MTNTLLVGTVADVTRSRRDLIVENALLRQQLLVLQRWVLPTEPVDKWGGCTEEQQTLDRSTPTNKNGRCFFWDLKQTA